jgi:hypothetical protein
MYACRIGGGGWRKFAEPKLFGVKINNAVKNKTEKMIGNIDLKLILLTKQT